MKKIIIHKSEPLRIKRLLTQTPSIGCNEILIYTDEVLDGSEYLNCFGPTKLSPEENINLANKYGIDKILDPAYYYNPYDEIIYKQDIREILTDRLRLEYNESEIIIAPGCREMPDKPIENKKEGFIKRLFNLWQS